MARHDNASWSGRMLVHIVPAAMAALPTLTLQARRYLRSVGFRARHMRKYRRIAENVNQCLCALPPSKIRLVRMRKVCTLIVMKCKPAFGAHHFRPFITVAQIDHDRGPGRGEGAFVLDREMDLQVLVLIVGVIRSGGPPILLGAALH